MALTDAKCLEILLEIFDADIEESLDCLKDSIGMFQSLTDSEMEKVLFLSFPALKQCTVPAKDLKELVIERIRFILERRPKNHSEATPPQVGAN